MDRREANRQRAAYLLERQRGRQMAMDSDDDDEGEGEGEGYEYVVAERKESGPGQVRCLFLGFTSHIQITSVIPLDFELEWESREAIGTALDIMYQKRRGAHEPTLQRGLSEAV
jgi:hypothetical protein